MNSNDSYEFQINSRNSEPTMEPKTFKSYQEEVLEKYEREKGGEMRAYLANPTRKQIREACIWLLNKRRWRYDDEILNRFFQFDEEKNKTIQIQRFNPDRFVPIIKFLKGKTNDTSIENLELIAWLIDFKPRPLTEYLNSDNPNYVRRPTRNIPDPKIGPKTTFGASKEDIIAEKKKERRKWAITISITFGAVLLTIFVMTNRGQNGSINANGTSPPTMCMTWADSVYVKVSCTKRPYSDHGTVVEPLDQVRLENFKKVKVTMATDFFSDDGKPMIWYFKNKDEEIEYYTAPGLHPINGETLRKITPYIIQTYVPKHIDRSDSFIK